MKPLVPCLFASLVLLSPRTYAVLPEHAAPTYVEGKVLVKYRAGVVHAMAKSSLGLRTLHSHLGGRLETLELPAMTTVAQVLPILRADPAVEYAEPDARRWRRATPTPDDPLFDQQWGIYSTGQANFSSRDPALASIPGDDLHLLDAWDPAHDGSFPGTGDGSATVAIIDDSVQVAHEDLAANIVPGYDFVNGDTDPSPDPGKDEFHGTLVAGCIGAVGNNGVGVAGVAWNVKLMPLKFNFDTDQFLSAMDFARTHGANIVNASFGGPLYSQAEVDGIQALRDDTAAGGILFVAAAGNDDSNTDIGQLNYPANYPMENIVSVAATNRQDNIASFSQYGPITVDVAAPGLQVVTTANTGYATNPGVSGTSFASPYTAGVAALLKMKYPAAPYGELKARLIEGADPGANARHHTAGGRVSAANSLNLAPRPALVLSALSFDGNGVLDSGETTTVSVTLANLWADATNVAVTLSADNGVTSNSGAVSFGNIAAHQSAKGSFSIAVPAGITDHRYVDFTLAVTADNGYSAERHFLSEIGTLSTTLVTQAFQPTGDNIYDDFHAWHFDLTALPTSDGQLVIETSAPEDIDLLVKKDAPPQYDIKVNPDTPDQAIFCTSGTLQPDGSCMDPDVYLSAGPSGNEQVVIDNPAPGTYHVVIVNFAQDPNGMAYTLHAYTRPRPVPASGGGHNSWVGSFGEGPLLGLALAAILRRRRRA